MMNPAVSLSAEVKEPKRKSRARKPRVARSDHAVYGNRRRIIDLWTLPPVPLSSATGDDMGCHAIGGMLAKLTPTAA